MTKNRKKLFLNFLKYTITLGIAGALLWYVYRDFSFESLASQFKDIDYKWLFLSICMALLSHYIRAYRWNILLKPLGYNLLTHRTYIAVMVGYFANNLVPRLGEVTRCGILKKNDNVSMTSAFGSVVAERALDLLMLILLAGITFIVEFDKLHGFVLEKINENVPDSSSTYNMAFTFVGILIALAVIAFFLFKMMKEKFHRNGLYIKVRQLIKELLEGFLSIRKLDNQTAFWLSTVGIWVLYYLMLIVVFFAFPPTKSLPLVAGLTLLIMSGLGMSAPVQGGIGVFHILVSSVLVLYGLSPEDGKVFALLAHTTQFVTIMIFGGLSFVISVFMKPRNSNVLSEEDPTS